MPYISKEDRDIIALQADADLEYIGVTLRNGGQLNYAISKIIKGFMGPGPYHYADFEPVITALEGAKFELLRRKLAMVEDDAIDRNGDL